LPERACPLIEDILLEESRVLHRRHLSFSGELVPTLFETCSFTGQPSHIVKVLAAHHIVANNLDFFYLGRVQQKAALNSNIMRNTADSERPTKIIAAQTDYRAFKNLDTLTSALNHLEVDSNGVAGF
jgi:hypothetical protein